MTQQEKTDLRFMQRAYALSLDALNAGEVPVGAVLVQNNKIIAEARNETIGLCDPSAHAEVLVLRRAATSLSNHRLSGTTLYVTLEPCLMCCGCLQQARVERLVFAAREPKTGGVVSVNEALTSPAVTHRVNITEGVLAAECADLLRTFFEARR